MLNGILAGAANEVNTGVFRAIFGNYLNRSAFVVLALNVMVARRIGYNRVVFIIVEILAGRIALRRFG